MQIAYAASDEVLVTGGYDQAIRLWDCRSRSFEPIQTLKNFGDAVTSVAVADRHNHMHILHNTLAAPECAAFHTHEVLVYLQSWFIQGLSCRAAVSPVEHGAVNVVCEVLHGLHLL